MNAVFLDLDTVDRGDLDLSPITSLDLNWRLHAETAADQVTARCGDAEIVVSNKVWLGDEEFQACPQLQHIVIAATGTNNIDLDAAAKRTISVSNVRDYATTSVVQHVFALMLALTTRLLLVRTAIQQRRWQQHTQFSLLDFPIEELSGKSLGIIGYGALGQAVATVARTFGMQVLIAKRDHDDQRSGRVSLNELLQRSDVISLHCPLTLETKGLIGQHELALMKPSALLINTARGGIVDEHALASAIKQQQIAGAGIDVLSEEPPRNGNPLLELDHPQLIVTPHIAWASHQSRQRLMIKVAENIQAVITGQAVNLVV